MKKDWKRGKKILSLLLVIVYSFAFSQWPTTINDELFIGYGTEPIAVSDGEGGIIIASTIYSVYEYIQVYKVNKYGFIAWEKPFRINKCEQAQILNHIIPDENGGIYLLYTDFTYLVYPYTKYFYTKLQHLDFMGKLVWDKCGLILCPPRDTTRWNADFSRGQMVSDNEGGVIVVWKDYRYVDAYSEYGDIYVQRIDYSGNCLWDSSGVRLSAKSRCYEGPKIVSDGESGAIVYYVEDGTGYFQKVDNNGNKIWGESGIKCSPLRPGPITMISDGQKGVFYTSRTADSSLFWNYFCQRLDSNGVFLWGDTGVYIGRGEDDKSLLNNPILNPDGSFSLTWWFRQKAYFQRITSEGEKVFPGIGISISEIDSAYAYAPVIGKNGDNFCFFSRIGKLSYDEYLFIQKIGKNGELLFGNKGICISANKRGVYGIVTDGNDGFILIFMEHPGYIFAKQVSGDGLLGKVNNGFPDSKDRSISSENCLFQNYPNPFNSITNIQFFLNKPHEIDLSVYTITGQHVITLTNGFFTSGRHSLFWNGTDKHGNPVSSGIYYYRLKSGLDILLRRKMLLIK